MGDTESEDEEYVGEDGGEESYTSESREVQGEAGEESLGSELSDQDSLSREIREAK